MFQFVLRRFLSIFVTQVIVSVLTFGLIFVSGDPATALTPTRPGQQPTEEQIEQTRKAYGLDQPIALQYLRYMTRLVQGDMGESYFARKPVTTLLLEKFPITFLLTLGIMAVALALGIPIGLLAAYKRNSAIDRAILIFSTLLLGAPPFFLGLMMIFFFAFRLKWFPLGGVGSVWHFVLPTLSIALPTAVGYGLLLRTNVLNLLNNEYARTARAKGLTTRAVLFRHILPNALIPVVTIASLDVAILLTGLVLIEEIFGIPGIGQQIFSGGLAA